jgi:hypothetical protein
VETYDGLLHYYSEADIYKLNNKLASSAPIAKQMVRKLQTRPHKEKLEDSEPSLILEGDNTTGI